jgi:tetratricopeptide (TPR) repeat protein
MKKDNLLFGIVGILAGLIIGFMFANSINQNAAVPVAASSSDAIKSNSNLPPGHPDIGAGKGTQGVMPPEAEAAIDKAKQSPTDFDAQVKGAEAYYTTQKFDEAIAMLLVANKLKPDDHEVVVHLGNANFDADHYEEAEKWYTQALSKKPDDVDVRTDLGLTFVFRDPPNYDRAIQEFTKSLDIDPAHIQTLQNLTVAYTKKGDAAKATSTLAKLEGTDPKNTAITRLKEDLAKLK